MVDKRYLRNALIDPAKYFLNKTPLYMICLFIQIKKKRPSNFIVTFFPLVLWTFYRLTMKKSTFFSLTGFNNTNGGGSKNDDHKIHALL